MRKFMSLSVLGAALLISYILSAQQATAIFVTVRVSDPTGTAVPHAQVRIAPSPDNAKAETDDNGRLTLNLRPGAYSVTVSAPGFKVWDQRIDVGMANGQATLIIPVVLQAGDVSPPMAVSQQDSLAISNETYHAPVSLSPAEFHSLPHVKITVHNGHTNASETYSGVPLNLLLIKVGAPLGKDLRGDTMTTFVLATGSDGYSVVLSLAEIDPEFHPGHVLVADARDGKPLGKSGPFQLIVSDDKRPARWVHNLASISVQRAR